jgi:hypothetical protein
MNALLKLRTITAITVIALASGLASAATIQDIIDGGGSVQVGNLVFSDFSVDSVKIGSGLSPLADEITYTLINTGDQAGIRFTGTWFAMGGGNYALSTIGFKVSVATDVMDDYDIVAAALNMPSHSTVGNGVISIIENVHSSDPDIQANSIAIMENHHNPGGNIIETDSSTFGEYDELWVRKNIVVAGAGSFDYGQLGQFSQLFTVQETPEPGTLGVMGIGGLGVMLARRRRTRKNHA